MAFFFFKKKKKWFAGFLFIKRNWDQDQKKIHATFNSIKRLQTPAWVISYAEGSRITMKKLEDAQNFSKQRNYPVLNHVLLPRTKGFVTCVNEFRNSHINHVYDFTITYRNNFKLGELNQAPSLMRAHLHSLWPEYEFHVHCRRFAIKDLPTHDEELGDWLRARWAEKDKILDVLKKEWIQHLQASQHFKHNIVDSVFLRPPPFARQWISFFSWKIQYVV